MEPMDMLVTGLIIAAFAAFMGVLGWAAHIDQKRPERDQLTAGE